MAGDDVRQGKSFKPGNTDENGGYKVGRNKPPEHGKFRAGDGRKRGRRKKGTKNLATDFKEELGSKVTLKVNGKQRRVTKQRAVVMRLFDNASRGQHSAIQSVMAMSERFGIEQSEEPVGSYDEFTYEELYEFERLMCKYQGVDPPEREKENGVLAQRFDPENEQNYYTERTVEGVHWRRCMIDDVPDVIERIESNAYFSAALPSRKLEELTRAD